MNRKIVTTFISALFVAACGQAPEPAVPDAAYDVLIVNGTVYDG